MKLIPYGEDFKPDKECGCKYERYDYDWAICIKLCKLHEKEFILKMHNREYSK